MVLVSTATIEAVSFVHVTMPIGAVQPGDQIERRGFRPEGEGLHSWWETVTKVESTVVRIDVDGLPTFYPMTSLSGERSDFLSCDSNTRILVRPKAV